MNSSTKVVGIAGFKCHVQIRVICLRSLKILRTDNNYCYDLRYDLVLAYDSHDSAHACYDIVHRFPDRLLSCV